MSPASPAACSSRDPPLHTLCDFLILAAISLFGRTDISIKPSRLQAQILISWFSPAYCQQAQTTRDKFISAFGRFFSLDVLMSMMKCERIYV